MPEPALLWHDDIRRAPPGWLWARTNEQAHELLQAHHVYACSLDHDLGLHELDPEWYERLPDAVANQVFEHNRSEATGLDLVHWLLEHGRVPPAVRIHSWNPSGAEAMRAALEGTPGLVRLEVEPHPRRY